MSIDLPFKSRLAAALAAGDTEAAITGDVSGVCACLGQPSHIFATVYTATFSERILITGCTGTTLHITRGVNGTPDRSWPADACVLLDTVVEGEVCGDVDEGGSDQPTCLDELNTGKGLTIDRTVPTAPSLAVAATGVTPGSYGGAEVNECGQLTFIPPGWPGTSLAQFDPCCEGGVSGPATDAASVSFAPDVGNTVATGLTVQDAIQQVDDYLTNFVVPDTGVQTITAGDCVTITGTAAAPVVSLSASGITPGTYAGFDINQCGVITGYTAPASSSLIVTGADPIQVSFDGNLTYTVSIAPASKTVGGAATLADESLVGGSESLIDGDNVVTWDFLQAWDAANSSVATVVAGHAAVTVTYDGVSTYTVTLPPTAIQADGDPLTVTQDAATGNFTLAVLAAAVAQMGVVRLADPSTHIAAPTGATAQDVVNVDYLEQWATVRGI